MLPPLSIEDFGVDYLVLEEDCFGSAGSLLVIEPELFYFGPDDRGLWDVTMRILGTDFGPTTHTMEVNTDNGTYLTSELFIGMPVCFTYPNVFISSVHPA